MKLSLTDPLAQTNWYYAIWAETRYAILVFEGSVFCALTIKTDFADAKNDLGFRVMHFGSMSPQRCCLFFFQKSRRI